ncbi:MAG: DNA-binding protein [Acidobacteria bacterium]|nr:DNA-binding protein [Acidobacteriota bacterium]
MAKVMLTAIVAISICCVAQQTRREVMNHTANPADERKPNSPNVPDALVFTANLKRVLVLRFKHNTDLLAELNKMVQQEKVRNAVILSSFGSVRNYQVHEVGNRDLPPKDIYIKDPTAPADIIGMSGVVIGGRVHAHITLANPDRAFGGHLEPDTTVFTFAVVALGVLDDEADLSTIDDWNYR